MESLGIILYSGSMNRNNITLIFLFILALPAVSAGEGTIDMTTTAAEERLPVSRVTLYTAGLAHMVHETTVMDDEILFFPVEHKDLNDILKSLVVEDLDGGTVETVSFDSDNPLSAILSDMRVNPSGSPALQDFLLRTQGESITASTANGSFSGRIFSVETQSNAEGTKILLNLMKRGEIQTVDITSLNSLKYEDPVLQQEMSEALSLIAGSRVKSSRILRFTFKGEGSRTVRISYIKAVPLWKTSYRIVLNREGIPRLEGWALVQNTGSLSWEDIQLGFVAGSPNAFTMDLSTPRYVYREQVDIASSAPIGATEYDRGYASEPTMMAKESYSRSAPSALYEEEISADFYGYEESYEPAPTASRATGIRSGNFYRYEVENSVTIEARSSAMIPIIQEAEAGRGLAVYDPSYDLVFKGLRLENDSDAHWAAGPVTILEGRFYGGDALMPEMIPDSKRLLTYALHGTVEVQKTQSQKAEQIIKLKMVDGLLYRTDKIERETLYRIEGSEKELILIHPRESGWELTESPRISEETPEEYRFSLENWKEPVPVKEEFIVSREFSLNGFSIQDYSYYMDWKGMGNEMRAAFTKMSRLKSSLENIRTQISALSTRISRRERDQDRVRQNMGVLSRDSELYKQYTDQLRKQEEDIQRFNRQIDDLQDEKQKADQDLKDYIASLEI